MKKVCFLSLLWFTAMQSFAQGKFIAKEVRGAEANAIWQGAEHIWLKQENTVPAFIQFHNGSEPDEEEFFFILKKTFHLPTSYNFSLISDESDQIGWQHKRFQLTMNSVPVSNSIFMLHLIDSKVKKFNGYLFKNISTNTTATVSETSALDFALENIGAQTYKWQLPEEENFLKIELGSVNASYYPKGNLEILQVGDNASNSFRLVWKFDIYAHTPLSRYYVYVDAQTGEMLKKSSRIQNANATGTATTVYRGNRTITTDSYNSQYRLREAPRGLGIHTYNMQTGTNYGNSIEFLDANNLWNNINAAKDQYAGDAHWGGEMTYDFYTTMGRNSIDNAGYALNLYMHYDVNYVNAFWDGTRMTFGDGNSTYNPLVSLDITGHEISHGLTERTSNLDYQNESGALNESFSDIFGTAVEWYADSTLGNWLIGEDIGSPFRSMSNPNSYGDPDTYLGTNWYTGTGDNGGVHTNSSVQNHWYYRLSQGGSGTNDIGNTFNVTGIGRHKATQISWRDNVNYLISTSDYADSRFYAIQSANDLFGVCSPEAIATTKAWYAVGVGGDFVYGADAQFTATPVSGCTVPFTVNFTNVSTNTSSYTWNFGDGGTSTVTNPSYTYNTLGTYTVKLVSDGGACGTDSLTRTNYISISNINPCIVIMPATGSYQTQTACNGTVYDNGGTGNYTNNTNSTVTIAPTGASQVKLHFTQFAMENTYDFLYVYDGPTTGSPVIGSYTGTTIPADITSTGSSITIRQSTDPAVVDVGFTIQWSCISPNAPPVANFKADVTQSCSGNIKFTDLSTGGPNVWLWNFGDGTTSTAQHPTHSYISNGTYTVSLKATNTFGNNTITKNNYISIAKPAGPSVANQSSCGPNSFTLNLSDVNPVTWFDSTGNVMANGNPFVTPVLNNTTTYFVQDTQTQPIYKVGALNNQIGGGAGQYYSTTQSRALRFRVYKNSKLVSVYVYAQGAGYRTVQYRDSLGGVITNKTVYMPNGASRIYLNIDLIPGGPYELGLRDTMNLWRNSAGAVYPYNDANGIVSIIGNNAAGSAAYYYFFYDWEVKENDCISQRVPVVATVTPVVTAATASTNVSCNGGSNATASITPSGGTPNFTYHWNNNASTSLITNLTAGTYTVTVTDVSGCSITASKTITQPTALVTSVTVTNVLCNGGNTGAINLNVTGGVTNYSYNWGAGIITQNRSSLSAGTYTVTITDGNLCTATTSAIVNAPSPLVVITTATNATCGQNNGSVLANSTGGTSGYTYSWSNGSNTSSLSNLTAGLFTVTVNDNNSCSSTSTATIINTGSIIATGSSANANCFGSADGSVAVNVVSGTQPYSYIWSNGASASSISNVTAGNYSVTITDGVGCVATITQTVSEPPLLNVSLASTDATCGSVNGTASVNATGGTQGYNYLWSNNTTTSSISNLAAGNYSVTVSDAHNCTAVNSVIVTIVSSISASVSSTSAKCNGSSDGTAIVTVAGGTQPINYLWSNGASASSQSTLSSGNYVVTITDGSNCVLIQSITISEPTPITLFVTAKEPSCNNATDGSAGVSAIGGNSNYLFNWSNAASGDSINNLVAGNYSVTVHDANNCSAVSDFILIEPSALSVIPTTTDVLCNGDQSGTASVSVSGGTPGYSYQWCNGNILVSTQNLSAGVCTVTITDQNDCTTSITIHTSEPNPIQFATSTSNSNFGANDGNVVVSNLTGGVGSYTFTWSNGDTTQNLTNVAGGTYSITVTDNNGCVETATVIVQDNPNIVNQISNEISLKIYPNPTSTEITVVMSKPNEGSILNLKNVLGQTLLTKYISSTETKIDLSFFASGVYVLEVKSGEKNAMNEIVISR